MLVDTQFLNVLRRSSFHELMRVCEGKDCLCLEQTGETMNWLTYKQRSCLGIAFEMDSERYIASFGLTVSEKKT